MGRSMKLGLVKVTLFSILLAMSRMVAIASVGDNLSMLLVHVFHGNVTLNGADTSPETIIDAYIEEEFHRSSENEVDSYYRGVEGNGSEEGGKVITFKVCGATADQTAVLHTSYLSRLLDLAKVGDEAPAVENANANANPPPIVADGIQESQLTATVTDGCEVGPFTVDLSTSGRAAAQVITCIEGTAVSTVTVTAAEGTAGGHGLYVNASDVFGNCNTSVCIALDVVEEMPTYAKGDLNHNGLVADSADVAMMLSASVGGITTLSV